MRSSHKCGRLPPNLSSAKPVAKVIFLDAVANSDPNLGYLVGKKL